jgi:phage baseplate assembly protein W
MKTFDLAFRSPEDPKYNPNLLEVSDKLENVLSKVRMLLYTNRGTVIGEPEFGMNLEEFMFDTQIDEQLIRERFYTQLAKYVPERDYKIDCEVVYQSDGVVNTVFLYITVDGKRVTGIVL